MLATRLDQESDLRGKNSVSIVCSTQTGEFDNRNDGYEYEGDNENRLYHNQTGGAQPVPNRNCDPRRYSSKGGRGQSYGRGQPSGRGVVTNINAYSE